MLGVPTIADRSRKRWWSEDLLGRAIFHQTPTATGRAARRGCGGVCRQLLEARLGARLDIQKFFDALGRKGGGPHRLPWVCCMCAVARPGAVARPCTSGPRYPARVAVSPVLANLFLHYAFDEWMAGSSRCPVRTLRR